MMRSSLLLFGLALFVGVWTMEFDYRNEKSAGMIANSHPHSAVAAEESDSEMPAPKGPPPHRGHKGGPHGPHGHGGSPPPPPSPPPAPPAPTTEAASN